MNLDLETPFSIGKSIFTSLTGTACLSLLLRMRTEGRCRLLAGEVAVGQAKDVRGEDCTWR